MQIVKLVFAEFWRNTKLYARNIVFRFIYRVYQNHIFGYYTLVVRASRSPVSLSQVTYFTKSFHRVIHLFHLPKKPISPRFTFFFCNSLRPISQYFTAMQTYFTIYVTMIPTFKDTFFVQVQCICILFSHNHVNKHLKIH